jgi:hypothetical protein
MMGCLVGSTLHFLVISACLVCIWGEVMLSVVVV